MELGDEESAMLVFEVGAPAGTEFKKLCGPTELQPPYVVGGGGASTKICILQRQTLSLLETEPSMKTHLPLALFPSTAALGTVGALMKNSKERSKSKLAPPRGASARPSAIVLQEILESISL